jgi:hypothetical protein
MFFVGQKVVCVNARNWDQRVGNSTLSVEHAIYTVREIFLRVPVQGQMPGSGGPRH